MIGLRAVLNEEIRRQTEIVTFGHAQDWGNYQEIVGYIKALRFALDACERMEKGLES